jgi:hypothetical protein
LFAGRKRLHHVLDVVRLARAEQHPLRDRSITRRVETDFVLAEWHIEPLEHAVEAVHRADQISVDVNLSLFRLDLNPKRGGRVVIRIGIRIRVGIRIPVLETAETPPERVVEVRIGEERVSIVRVGITVHGIAKTDSDGHVGPVLRGSIGRPKRDNRRKSGCHQKEIAFGIHEILRAGWPSRKQAIPVPLEPATRAHPFELERQVTVIVSAQSCQTPRTLWGEVWTAAMAAVWRRGEKTMAAASRLETALD